jgi:hypothetical protein
VSAGLGRGLVLALRLVLVAALGAGAAFLVACGASSGGVLIPASEAGPLRADIEAVEQAAASGDGNCATTEKALLKTAQDYAALPSSVDTELRNRLHLGIENLHKVATEACEEPIAKTTSTTTTTPPKTTTTTTTPPTTTTAPPTTPTVTTPPATEGTEEPGAGGGTPGPGEGQGKAPGEGAGGAGAEEEGPRVNAEGVK